MENSLIVLYHRPPFKKIIQEGVELYSEKVKPNGIIPILNSFFSIVKAGVWICCEETNVVNDNYRTREHNNCTLKTVPVNKVEIDNFYNKTSKEGFWPLLHSRTEKFHFDSVNWENFLEINRRFANAAVESATESSIIWIHDYNLWMAPFFIREKLPQIKIVFFHHTPFPPPDIFNILPWRKEIIKSLLCCDLCCFNIPRYVENFVQTAKSILDVEIVLKKPVSSNFLVKGALFEPEMSRQLLYNDRIIYLDAIPEGPDHHAINKLLEKNSRNELSIKIKEAALGRKVIFSASRIDYIKGTAEMLRSFEEVLKKRQNLIEKIVLCLISVCPSEGMVAYNETQMEIEHLVGRINGRYSSVQYTPVMFFTEDISFEEMIIWYDQADILVIPSLRDGMNLISKEYIAVKKGLQGSLILSEFAGAAVELEGAILTNPYSIKSLVSAFELAIDMSSQECHERMKKMYQTINYSNVYTWATQLNYCTKKINSEKSIQ